MDRFSSYQVSWTNGIVAGVLAFVTGYLLTRHLVLLGSLPQTSYEAGETTTIGWFYYNSHRVPLSETASLFGETASATGYDLITMEESSDYLEFLYIVPPITLFVAGVLSAANYGKTRTISFAALNGAAVVTGYLFAVLIGVFFFSESVTEFGVSGTMRPSIGYAIAAGIAYPLIFGGLGGIVYFFSQGSIRLQIQ